MSTSSYYVIDFPLRQNLPAQSVDFLPFGTRTLKIRVTNPDNVPGNLIIRTRHVPKGFGKKLFYGHEQKTANFRVSWGGGQEKGTCLQGEDIQVAGKKVPIRTCRELTKDESYLYMNVTHVTGPFNQSYTLRLAIYAEDDSLRKKPRYQLDLELKPPQQILDDEATNPIRLRQQGDSYVFSGTDVPAYVNRWWTPQRLAYLTDAPALPALRLETDDNLMKVKSGRNFKDTIAEVQDNILFQGLIDKARYFDADLYHFTKHFFVLRLWFAWLEKHSGRTTLDEIPDAERFDLVIDAKKSRVVYAATDMHWREVWVPGPRSRRKYPVAHLGLFSHKGLSFISEKLPLVGNRYDGWLEWIEQMIHEEEEAAKTQGHRDTGPRIPSHYVKLAVEERLRAGDLGANVEAHVPYFENVQKPERVEFISSDPTQG